MVWQETYYLLLLSAQQIPASLRTLHSHGQTVRGGMLTGTHGLPQVSLATTVVKKGEINKEKKKANAGGRERERLQLNSICYVPSILRAITAKKGQ